TWRASNVCIIRNLARRFRLRLIGVHVMSNPLLQKHLLPPFSAIQPEHVEPAIRQLIDDSRAHMQQLLDTLEHPTWDSLVAPLEEQGDLLEQAWSPVSHLNAVCNNDA